MVNCFEEVLRLIIAIKLNAALINCYRSVWQRIFWLKKSKFGFGLPSPKKDNHPAKPTFLVTFGPFFRV